MVGDEKSRYCYHCKLNVFNLSAMELDEAANLIAEKDGHLCVRFYRRRDGSIITQDCPKGIERARRKLIAGWTAAAGLITAAFGSIFSGLMAGRQLVVRPTMGVPSAPLTVKPIPVIKKEPWIERPAVIMGARAMPFSGTAVQGQPVAQSPSGNGFRMHELGEYTGWTPEGSKSEIKGEVR